MRLLVRTQMRKTRLLTVLIFVFSVFAVFAASNGLTVPESAKLRSGLIESWFELPVDLLRDKPAEVFTNEAGELFQVRAEIYDDSCAIIIAPQKTEKVESYSDAGVNYIFQTTYPYGAPGCWVLFRDLNKGKPLGIRYFFAGDFQVFVQFKPGILNAKDKSAADFVIFDTVVAENVPIGLPLKRFYSMSFSDMKKFTEKNLPWKMTSFLYENYLDKLQMVEIIRENLPRFVFEEDAAYDEKGNPVYIKDGSPRSAGSDYITVSSPGFVKWIIDGLLIPFSGNGVRMEPLLERTEEFRSGGLSANMADQYYTTIALDWIRNLATATVSVSGNRNYTYETSGVEVNNYNFADFYIKKAGYRIEKLKSLLYLLACAEPDYFYLGALRQPVKNENEFVVWNECAAFFPYFNRQGQFSVAVFENGREIKLEEYIRDNQNKFIQLTRVRASNQFFPR